MLPIDLVYQGLSHGPDRVALIDGARRMSHGELVRDMERLAARIARDTPDGARIGLCAPNVIDHVVAYLAILRAGRVWVPLNPKNGLVANSDLVVRAGADLVLVTADCTHLVDAGHVPVWTDFTGIDGTLPPAPAPEDIAAIKFTGGTTGVPKGVMQSHRCMMANIRNMQALYGLGADDVNLAVAPLTHGSSHYVLPILGAGGAHILMKSPDRAAVLAHLKSDVSITFMPPTLIQMLMEEGHFAPADFPRLRHLSYGAAPMAPARIAEAIDRFGPAISAVYGQTEAPMTITALSPIDMLDPDLRSSAGRACVASEIALNDNGEILVRGDLLMSGYLNDPAATAKTIIDGWLHTGDLGTIDDRGYLRIIGRVKDLIITGGYNVYPAEVEAAVLAIPGIAEACVFAVDDDKWGERVEVAITLDGSRDFDADAAKAAVKAAVGAVKVPKAFHILDQLPRNAVGKVVRREIRELVYG